MPGEQLAIHGHVFDTDLQPAETYNGDHVYGNAYTTALVVLSLSAPNQLLPIFPR